MCADLACLLPVYKHMPYACLAPPLASNIVWLRRLHPLATS